MFVTTEGIVLKTQKFADADLIITYLTLNKGITKTFAKSPLKTKSRFGSSLEPFTHAKITLMGKEQSMPKITQSDIIQPFNRLRENLHDFIYISKLAEIIIALIPENIPSKKLFLFFLHVFGIIETSNLQKKNILYAISLIHLLKILGYIPRLNGCGKCGGESFDFYPDLGTTLCRPCAADKSGKNFKDPVRVTGKMIKFYAHTTGWPLQISTRLRPSEETLASLFALLESHLNYLLKKRLNSSDFLARV